MVQLLAAEPFRRAGFPISCRDPSATAAEEELNSNPMLYRSSSSFSQRTTVQTSESASAAGVRVSDVDAESARGTPVQVASRGDALIDLEIEQCALCRQVQLAVD